MSIEAVRAARWSKTNGRLWNGNAVCLHRAASIGLFLVFRFSWRGSRLRFFRATRSAGLAARLRNSKQTKFKPNSDTFCNMASEGPAPATGFYLYCTGQIESCEVFHLYFM